MRGVGCARRTAPEGRRPVRVEIEQVVGAPRHYRVWCDLDDGYSEMLHQVHAVPEEMADDPAWPLREWLVAGLRAAVLAAQMRWGWDVAVDLSRARHRGTLRIVQGAWE